MHTILYMLQVYCDDRNSPYKKLNYMVKSWYEITIGRVAFVYKSASKKHQTICDE